MTQRTSNPLPFSSTNQRKIVAEFRAGDITSDAGLLLLREADRQLGLLDEVNNAIPDPRSPLLVLHPQRTLLAQRIFGIACGYEDLNDHQQLRNDPLWQTATDHPEPNDDPTLASPPTLCRMENRITRPSLVRLSQVLVEKYISSYAIPPEEITLDFDGTDDTIHGNQECGFFNGYYDSYCFLPLYVYSGSQLLVAYLRPANIAGNYHAAAILKLLVTRLRQAWPNVRITIRGDSAFCRWRLMRWCESNDIRYIFGLGRNSVLERLSSEWVAQAQTAHDLDGQTHRTFGAFSYQAQTWDRSRRVIVKAEHLCGPDGGRANPRYIVTNESGDPRALYEDRYCQRGDMENRIKEQQLGLFADRTSCQSFLANQFRVLLAAFAYVLIEHIRRTALVGTELAAAQVSTIRLRLFRVAALVTVSVRRVLVNFAASFVSRDLFVHVAEVLRRSGPCFNSS
jgi:Transposase DDE domain group 1